ncbi:MAG: hypothetical protein JXD18_10565, partial [Anaerolineae bacterium]|nr:hypothetical protein [Anaerolineae bacterium]
MDKLPDGRQLWRQKYTWMWLGVCALVGLSDLYVYVAVVRWHFILCLGLVFLAIPIAYLALPVAWRWARAELAEGGWLASGVEERGELLVGVSADRWRRPVYWSRRLREAPTLVLGGARRGKSSWQAFVTSQDIRRGETVAVVDPHR